MAPNKKKNGKNGKNDNHNKSKSNLKQGNLFSFFSKSVVAAKAKTIPKPESNASNASDSSGTGSGTVANNKKDKKPSALTTATATATTVKQVVPPPSSTSASALANVKATPPPPSSSSQQTNNPKTTTKNNRIWKKLIVGSKIGIYWKDDKCYYPCTIEKLDTSSSNSSNRSSRFFVRYDDGESEWTDMSTEKLRWLEDDEGDEDEDSERDDSEEDTEKDHDKASKFGSTSANKKRSHRRSIQESDDEDDEEEQEWKDPGDDDESDDDDDDLELEEEEVEDEDNWMVTDDDDDEESSSSPKKKKAAGRKKSNNNKNKKTVVKITTHPSSSSSSTTPPPFAKRMKSSSTSSTTTTTTTGSRTTGGSSSAFKTPLKNFSHTISPRTSSTLKSSNNLNLNASAMKTTSRMTPTMTTSPLKTTTTTTTTTTKTVDLFNLRRLNPHFLSMGNKPLQTNEEKGALNIRGAHIHNHLKFLRYPQDSMGRYRDHINYDCRTLKVNYQEWNTVMNCKEMTSAVKQWWEIKSNYFDTILFFKTGKFYELFHMDADIGVQILGFNYMKGKPAHAGFPEISYGQFADKLVRAGYKVARVEQTETPAMLQIRKSNTPKSQKKPQVVNREVCSIMTLGTRTYCSLDVKLALLEEGGMSLQDGDDQCGGPLLVIREVLYDQDNDDDDQDDDDQDSTDGGVQPVCEYGITLIDAIRGTVTLGMFADDVLRNRMRTLLISFHPSEILIQGGGRKSSSGNDDDGNGTSKELLSLLKSYQNETRTPCSIEIINQNESYPKSTALNKEHARNLERDGTVRPWNVNETLQELHRKKYYPRSSRKKSNNNNNDVSRWPIVLKMVVEGDANLCLSSFGAALFYLQRNLIDREILSMNIVRAYIPAAVTSVSGSGTSAATATAAAAASTTRTAVRTTTVATTTNNIDDFWTSQQQQQQQGTNATAAVTQESLLDELEENPLYKIPTATPQPQPHQQQHASAAAPSIAAVAAVADNNGEDTITHMSLDGTTLHNLEILTNAVDYKIVGSLWSKLNYTKSPHGSRMLRAWLLRPLFKKNEIERRGDAVEELIRGAGNLSLKEARDSVLNKIGDLDRLLSRVHSMSVGVSSGGGSPAICNDDDDDYDDDIISNEYHPNERAVLYEGKTYTKRKVLDFKNLLKGLQKACQLPEIFSDIDLDPNGFVFKLVRLQKDGGLFPDMVESLDWFMDNFDCEKAAEGEFVPSRGTDPIYDQACDAVNQVKEDLENYKQEMIQDHLKPRHVAQRSWKYANIKPDSKDKYLIELPVNVQVPHDFHVKGKRGTGQKQINKYQTPVVVELVKELEQAYEIQQTRKAKGMQIIFAKFDTQRPLWAAAAQATAILDALGSLAIMAGNPGYCRAEILDCPAHQQPSINIVQGRHPVVENTFHSSDFIPNDLQLGPNPNKMDDSTENGDSGDSARLLLLSGPNMGGKSTMLRQTCLIAILAQIGSYVPAESCQMTPIDCIFTRLGASDRILLGQSTFFVELAETAAALRGATRRSLVIMDELGRGTSTFDGTAIASATVKHLVERSQCLSLFATHYHSLLDEWRNAPNVRLGHMQCIVDDENENEATTGSNGNITFLYTLGLGSCPRSFGINVAKLAGLPDEVLANAKRVSEEFEDEMNGVGSDTEVGTAVGPHVSDEEANIHLENIRQLIACQQFDDVLSVWKTIQTI